jgi:hypothetical protein
VRLRLLTPIAILALSAALLGGCGSGGDPSSSGAPPPSSGASAPAGASAKSCETQAADAEALRATNVGCDHARQLMLAWQRDPGCAPGQGASRSACSIGTYRCLSVLTAKGVSVGCAQPGRSVAFIARRG